MSEHDWEKIEPDVGEGKGLPMWKPQKEGDMLEGVLMEKKEKVGRNKSNIYTFLSDDDEIQLWGSVVIDSRLKNIPADGTEMVRIEYLGEKEGENGMYKDYDIFHRPVE
ncbi:MAG TPA: hypothetical protein ENI04_01225 [Candidatus Wildermuthbacteria bacterium]|nr:hypothetical protein [Candidatus Wildermuthbacteria bacterium]